MGDLIRIDRNTRVNRRIDAAVWIERRTVFINGTRKHALPFISEWLDGANLLELATRHRITFEQAESVIRWWQREQKRKFDQKIDRLRREIQAIRGEA